MERTQERNAGNVDPIRYAQPAFEGWPKNDACRRVRGNGRSRRERDSGEDEGDIDALRGNHQSKNLEGNYGEGGRDQGNFNENIPADI